MRNDASAGWRPAAGSMIARGPPAVEEHGADPAPWRRAAPHTMSLYGPTARESEMRAHHFRHRAGRRSPGTAAVPSRRLPLLLPLLLGLVAVPAVLRAQPSPTTVPPGVLHRLAAEARDLALLCYEVPPATAGAAAGARRPWRGGAVEVPALDALSLSFAAAAERAFSALAALDREAAARQRREAAALAPGPVGRMLTDPQNALRLRENPAYGAEFCAAQRSELEDWATGLAVLAAPRVVVVLVPFESEPAASGPATPAPPPPGYYYGYAWPGYFLVLPPARRLHGHAAARLHSPPRFLRSARPPHLVERPARPGRVIERIRQPKAQAFDSRPGHHHGIVGAQPQRGSHQPHPAFPAMRGGLRMQPHFAVPTMGSFRHGR